MDPLSWVAVPSAGDRVEAQRLDVALHAGRTDELVLSGEVDLVVIDAHRFGGLDGMRGHPVHVRIGYNPSQKLKGMPPGCRLLTYHKHLIGFIDNEELLQLDDVLRRNGLHMVVKCLPSHDGSACLFVPPLETLRELSRVIRLHRKWPLPDSLLEKQFMAEREYARIQRDKRSLTVTFTDARRVPRFVVSHPFWSGRCYAVEQLPDPGVRRAPICRLMSLFGCDEILSAKRRGDTRANIPFAFLHRYRIEPLDVVCVGVLPAGHRKPLIRIAVAPSSQPI